MRSGIAIILSAAIALIPMVKAGAQEKNITGDVRSTTVENSQPLLAGMKAAAERFFASEGADEVWVGYSVEARERLRDSFNNSNGDCTDGVRIVNGIVQSYPSKGIVPAGSEYKAILYLFAAKGKTAKLKHLVVLDLSNRYRFTLPLLWLDRVATDRSLAALQAVLGGGSKRAREGALAAVALHRGDEPGRILERIVRGDDPVDFREDALFWLGFTVDPDDLDLLIRLEKDLTHPDMREQLTFLYYLLKSDRAVDRLIAVARSDRSRDVREQAIFWMGQLAGAKVAGELEKMAEDDPEMEIKKQAVFALSQMDGSKSIEALVRIARTNKSAAVRKQAIFWIGQSGDEQAVDFLAELLKK